MTQQPLPRSILRWSVPALALLALGGCSDERVDPGGALPGVVDRLDLLGIPTIHSIGESSILTYEPGKPLEIKIMGNDLHDPDLVWSISINGIAPLQSGVDFTLRMDQDPIQIGRTRRLGEDDLAIVVNPGYVGRIQSGDPLTISIQLSNVRLMRKYQGIKGNIGIIETQQAAVRALASEVMSATVGAPDVAALTKLRVETTASLRPVVKALAELHEISQASRDLTAEILAQLRTYDPSSAQAAASLEAIEAKMVLLRSQYREFVRTNTAYSPVISAASRHFVLFSAEDYRQKFIGATVPLNELNAFPIPEAQVRRIFGPVVADEFFVVAISISNFSEQDRLIDTGMIKAAGRALICPRRTNNLGGPVFNFTVPIEVVPQSTEQVYTLVSDSKKHQGREWFFRSLEFAGSLAVAAGTGFNADLDLVKGLGIFTGVALPGAQTLWPDDVPGFQRNIIAFGMPDLVKVNGKSTVGHRVLFFSKQKLQLMVSDPLLFDAGEVTLPRDRIQHPDQFVVQMAFDSLMVSFDNITSPTKGSIEERMAAARRAVEELIADERQIAQAWNGENGNMLLRQLRHEQWQEISQWLLLWRSAGITAALPGEEGRLAGQLLQSWRDILERVAADRVKADLTGHEQLGIGALLRHLQALDSALAYVATGNAARLYASRLEDAERTIAKVQRLTAWYRLAASLLVEVHQGGLIQPLLKGGDRDPAVYAYGALHARLSRLIEEGRRIEDLMAMPALPEPLSSVPVSAGSSTAAGR